MNRSTSVAQRAKLASENLRWHLDSSKLGFETTADVSPGEEIYGQEEAQEALRFGFQCNAPGQNIFIRGTRGTGRLLLVRHLLRQLNLTTDKKRDRCYVNNFKRLDRPRLISLQPGRATAFQKAMGEFAEFVQTGLPKTLDSEPFVSQRTAIRESVQEQVRRLTEPLEKTLADNSMALVSVQHGNMTVPAILPVVEGQPIPTEQFNAMVQKGEIEEERAERFNELFPGFQKQIQAMARKVTELVRDGAVRVDEFNQRTAREALAEITDRIKSNFPGDDVATFIDEAVSDAVENRIFFGEDAPAERLDLSALYGVNIVLQHSDSNARPVVEELTPTMVNLLGTVEPRFGPDGAAASDYTGVRGGALLQADQGILILNVEDVLAEPGAWRALMRTVRAGSLEIVPADMGWMRPFVVIQPDPIPINVRVVLIGEVETYYLLDRYDNDFRDLFKVLADFDTEISRDELGIRQYAAILSRLARDESLPHFHHQAVGALAEHGARIVARQGKLTARFGRIADIAREAAFLATQQEKQVVQGDHVLQAIRRTKRRASLPSRRFQELMDRGTIIVQTSGDVVGQINGLAVMQAGPLTYGFPARITASIGAGQAGLIDIEGSARLSGSIHTKGFYILGGLLRFLLPTDHPLAFSASLAFEQSYGGIDGDSASCAEICCLLSALTGIPIRQSLAITGAIDQLGHVQAIGGVTEKIEGFFDVCQHFGLTGDQGVIIPKSNSEDLMLRQEVVDAAAAGKFHVYAVDNVFDALELLTGVAAGRLENGQYPPETLLSIALEKSHEFWLRALARPGKSNHNGE